MSQYPQYPPQQRSGTATGCLIGGLIAAAFFLIGVPAFFIIVTMLAL